MKPGRTIVIGGGAAGLMAAGRAAERGAEVILLEKMERTGRKIGISGKGRCNLGNTAQLAEFLSHFGKNGNFLRQCFQQFFTPEMMSFFEQRNLSLVTERGGRIFPASGRALDVVRVLGNWVKAAGVSVQTGVAATAIVVRDGRVRGVKWPGRRDGLRKRHPCHRRQILSPDRLDRRRLPPGGKPRPHRHVPAAGAGPAGQPRPAGPPYARP